jgi:hypothetical protein
MRFIQGPEFAAGGQLTFRVHSFWRPHHAQSTSTICRDGKVQKSELAMCDDVELPRQRFWNIFWGLIGLAFGNTPGNGVVERDRTYELQLPMGFDEPDSVVGQREGVCCHPG